MGSFLVTNEHLNGFLAKPGQAAAMNQMEGFSIIGLTEPEVNRLLPPQLQLTDEKNPLFYLYGAKVGKPTFSKEYYEVGLGLFVKKGILEGIYYLNLQLSGPGAEMATYIGRENAGFPKKLAEKIELERVEKAGTCKVTRHGTQICCVELNIGENAPAQIRQKQEGCSKEAPIALQTGSFNYLFCPKGAKQEIDMQYLPSIVTYSKWEKAEAAVTLDGSIDDPWNEIPIRSIISAGWMNCDLQFGTAVQISSIPESERTETLQRLMIGKYDNDTFAK